MAPGHDEDIQPNTETTEVVDSAAVSRVSKDPGTIIATALVKATALKPIGQIPGLRIKFQVVDATSAKEVESLIQDHIELLAA